MNLEQVKAMSDKELRIKVAELTKWVKWWMDNKNAWTDEYLKERYMLMDMPDYVNDLNAMHEAAKSIPENKLHLYCDLLLELSGENYGGAFEATARQKAEAFVLTVNNNGE